MVTVLLIAATVTNALATGAMFDQTVKQLPARHRIGAGAYTAYVRAADLRNGLIWYPAVGACTALSTVAAVVTGLRDVPTVPQTVALVLMAAGTASLVATASLAARTLLSLRRRSEAVAESLDRFARINAIGVTASVATLAATVWALVLAVTP